MQVWRPQFYKSSREAPSTQLQHHSHPLPTLLPWRAGLAEDDGQEGAAAAAAAASDKVATHQSFTDLVYSRGRALSAVQWHPSRRGVMAVACTQPLGLAEHGGAAQQGGAQAAEQPSAILLWEYKDPIHPKAVLQASSSACCSRLAGCAAEGSCMLPAPWLSSWLLMAPVHNLPRCTAGALGRAGLCIQPASAAVGGRGVPGRPGGALESGPAGSAAGTGELLELWLRGMPAPLLSSFCFAALEQATCL